jgi:hypothetical protein
MCVCVCVCPVAPSGTQGIHHTLQSDPKIHLQDQYSIPFPFLRCQKCKAEILRVDRNKHLIQI